MILRALLFGLLAFGLTATFSVLGARAGGVWLPVGVAAGLCAGLLLQWNVVRRRMAVLRAVRAGMQRLGQLDFTPQPVPRVSGEAAMLVRAYEEVGERLRASVRNVEQHREWMVALLDASSMAVVVYADAGLIRYTSAAARELFFEGRAVEGQNFLSMLANAPPALRQALLGESDQLFTVEAEGEAETYHLSKRTMEVDGSAHSVVMVKRVTRELSRAEVETWKKAIRVMSHELNNSLAPISSLVHSAKLIAEKPEHHAKLQPVLDTIAERSRHLQTFLEGYARLARLPKPRAVTVEWASFLASVQRLHPHVRIGPAPAAPGYFDPAQLEQVLINLLKNAVEAGGPADAVEVEVAEADGGFRLSVHDRGRGMSSDVMQHAVLPFYSTKEKGTGLGLALCREIVEAHGGRLKLENRAGGGATVTLWLPGRNVAPGAQSRARLTITRA